MKQIIIIALVVIAIVAGAVVFSNSDGEQAAGAQSNNFYGAEEGVVTLTEYGDFQCPACAGFYPVFKQVKEDFKDRVRFEFKHYPLVQIHPNAQTAHRAAQAASKQGKFWEMHDLLYERQQSWGQVSNPGSVFEQYASELELDIEQYKSDFSSSETLATINADIAAGKAINANSTPTFALNGEKIEELTGLSTVEGMSEFLEDAIAEATGESTTEEVTDPVDSQEPATQVEEQTGE